MNFYQIRSKFDEMCRTAGQSEMHPLRDSWINEGWRMISQNFAIPSLVKDISFDSVANQQFNNFPLDYDGMEIGLKYNGRRLDPVPDDTLRLKYERRTSGMGTVKFYDWTGVIGEDLLRIDGVSLTGDSKIVQLPATATSTQLNLAHWVRFNPYEDGDNVGSDNNDMVDPQDYAYLIKAGSFVPGLQLELMTRYKGPTGTAFRMVVRPAETQRFVTYGIPTSAEINAFDLRYYSKPRRLYDKDDVPEWDVGEPIALMAMSVCLEFFHNMDLSKQLWGRAMQRIKGLEKRRAQSQRLVTDLTIGSVAGRKTGIQGVRRGFGRYR